MAKNADQKCNDDAEWLEDFQDQNAGFNSGLLMAMPRYSDVTAAFCR
ncbi:MAG: hypothetical protein K2X72_26305 [Reyranella sp.]|nr:hypothetical protein [Reyranella sp.]